MASTQSCMSLAELVLKWYVRPGVTTLNALSAP